MLTREALTDPPSQELCRDARGLFWEVEWEGKVNIGMTYRGIQRKGSTLASKLGRNNISWMLLCQAKSYAFLYNDTKKTIKVKPGRSSRVRVYQEPDRMSFYRVPPSGSSDPLTLIYNFTPPFTQEDLLPGFAIWRVKDNVSSVSLSRVSHTHTHTGERGRGGGGGGGGEGREGALDFTRSSPPPLGSSPLSPSDAAPAPSASPPSSGELCTHKRILIRQP